MRQKIEKMNSMSYGFIFPARPSAGGGGAARAATKKLNSKIANNIANTAPSFCDHCVISRGFLSTRRRAGSKERSAPPAREMRGSHTRGPFCKNNILSRSQRIRTVHVHTIIIVAIGHTHTQTHTQTLSWWKGRKRLIIVERIPCQTSEHRTSSVSILLLQARQQPESDRSSSSSQLAFWSSTTLSYSLRF